MPKLTYKNLHRWMMNNKKQKIAHNVSCGLTRKGKRIIGCGKRATLNNPNYGYYFYLNKGLISTVYLCKKCKRKVGK